MRQILLLTSYDIFGRLVHPRPVAQGASAHCPRGAVPHGRDRAPPGPGGGARLRQAQASPRFFKTCTVERALFSV